MTSRCKLCNADAMIRDIIRQAYCEGHSVRDITYFVHLCLGQHIGKDTIYRHFREHDLNSYQFRIAYQHQKAGKNPRTYPQRTDPMKVLEAMNG
jgi:hypothetical protein